VCANPKGFDRSKDLDRPKAALSAETRPGDAQGNDSVLETLLSLILSEKAGINIQENAASSKPLEEFIRQFTSRASTGNVRPVEESAGRH
jgi:hypothetical protein